MGTICFDFGEGSQYQSHWFAHTHLDTILLHSEWFIRSPSPSFLLSVTLGLPPKTVAQKSRVCYLFHTEMRDASHTQAQTHTHTVRVYAAIKVQRQHQWSFSSTLHSIDARIASAQPWKQAKAKQKSSSVKICNPKKLCCFLLVSSSSAVSVFCVLHSLFLLLWFFVDWAEFVFKRVNQKMHKMNALPIVSQPTNNKKESKELNEIETDDHFPSSQFSRFRL